MDKQSRRQFIRATIRGALFGGMALVTGELLFRDGKSLFGKNSKSAPTVWQLDPAKCIQCGRCAL